MEEASPGAGIVEQKRQAASDAWSTSNSSSMRLFDTAQHSASSNTEEGRALNNTLSDAGCPSQWSSTLENTGAFTKAQADESVGKANGTFNADVAISSMLGTKEAKQLSAGKGASPIVGFLSRPKFVGQLENRKVREGRFPLSRTGSLGDSARQARESFYRQTSSSSNSQLRGLSQEVTQGSAPCPERQRGSLARGGHLPAVSELLCRAAQQQLLDLPQRDAGLRAVVQEQMLDPANRNLDHTYRPGQINQTASQQGTENILLKRYENAKSRRCRPISA
jgi:conjugal transfer mating pair stabilization protein TraG